MDIKLPAFQGTNAKVEDRMHWVKVPFSVVLGLYNEKVLRVQRHHLRRAKEASHLRGEPIPLHRNFLAIRSSDLKLQLIDGYTRITAVLNGESSEPEEVWLGVVDLPPGNTGDEMYDAVDSKYAVKRGRDTFEEGLRRSGLLDKLQSPIFARAQAVSAVQAAAGTGDVRKGVYAVRKGIQALDPLHLHSGRGGVPAGALAAFLLMATHENENAEVVRFAAAVARPRDVPTDMKSKYASAMKCAAYLQEKREASALSGKNVLPIMADVLGYWLQHRDDLKPHRSVSREDYLQLVS